MLCRAMPRPRPPSPARPILCVMLCWAGPINAVNGVLAHGSGLCVLGQAAPELK